MLGDNFLIVPFNSLIMPGPLLCGGARARTKGSGLGPDGVGLRGFKSHPPHQTLAGVTPLIALLLLFFSAYSIALLNACATFGQDEMLRGMISFLKAQYVKDVGLLRAAKTVYPDNQTFWVASDNLLAGYALLSVGDQLAIRILSVLNDSYGGGFNGLHEVLIGYDIPDRFYSGEVVRLGIVSVNSTEYLIAFDNRSAGSEIEDWHLYADLIVYRAIDLAGAGDLEGVKNCWEMVIRLWDGVGFRDRAFNGRIYQTYKVSLAYYLFRILEAADPEYASKYAKYAACFRGIVGRLQRADGGIVTGYVQGGERLVPIGDANVETTSITILAFYSDYPLKYALNLRRSHSSYWQEPILYATLTLVTVISAYSMYALYRLEL